MMLIICRKGGDPFVKGGIFLFSCLLFLLAGAAAAQEKKIDLPELISRHQEALGSSAARNAIKSRFAAGTVKFVSRMGTSVNLEGTIGLVSLNPKLRYSIKFPSQQYPGEQLADDGKNLDTGVLQGGRPRRSGCSCGNRTCR